MFFLALNKKELTKLLIALKKEFGNDIDNVIDNISKQNISWYNDDPSITFYDNNSKSVFNANYLLITSDKKIPNCILHIYAILVVVIGWIFFRADNLSIAIKYISIMFGLSYNEKIPFTLAYYLTRKEIIVGAIAIICSVPWVEKTCKISTLHNNWIILTRRISMLLLLIASMVSIAASSYNPFIYFRF